MFFVIIRLFDKDHQIIRKSGKSLESKMNFKIETIMVKNKRWTYLKFKNCTLTDLAIGASAINNSSPNVIVGTVGQNT